MSELPEDWREQFRDYAATQGFSAIDDDMPDSILIATARTLCEPGSSSDQLADALAEDIMKHATEPVTRAACLILLRASCDAQALAVIGWSAKSALSLLAAVAAKLEMKVKS